jgi:hypothetical protein
MLTPCQHHTYTILSRVTPQEPSAPTSTALAILGCEWLRTHTCTHLHAFAHICGIGDPAMRVAAYTHSRIFTYIHTHLHTFVHIYKHTLTIPLAPLPPPFPLPSRRYRVLMHNLLIIEELGSLSSVACEATWDGAAGTLHTVCCLLSAVCCLLLVSCGLLFCNNIPKNQDTISITQAWWPSPSCPPL